MTDADDPTPIDQRDTSRSPVPFLAAAVVAVLVVGGIVALAVARPVENNVTDSDRIAIAARNFATAQEDSDAARRATTACAGFDAGRSPLGPDAVGKKVEIVRVTDAVPEGDHARATVTSRIDGHETTSTWNLARGDEGWLVCDRP
ncbi:hypothetical protein BJY24_003037 [Nocardia transvalensis]|uniref:Lumazine-binding protein n=1 Tax=Nocardia transvalensis TaxID=37333 RepID=A0A7W9PDZ6_9NOCA|nr:hypothetical protein [Nocardia transvalensis]MBB5914170.1 hypothetical protein [Nocardia transvalensis]